MKSRSILSKNSTRVFLKCTLSLVDLALRTLFILGIIGRFGFRKKVLSGPEVEFQYVSKNKVGDWRSQSGVLEL